MAQNFIDKFEEIDPTRKTHKMPFVSYGTSKSLLNTYVRFCLS